MDQNEITFRLSRKDAGQILDALTVCHENWQKTLQWFDGTLEDPAFVILDCDDREEAACVTGVYADLLETFASQMRP